MTVIIGIRLSNRTETSPEFQNVLSKYGCMIKTRIGLHSTCSAVCSNYGIVLLEIIDDSEIVQMKKDLMSVEGVMLSSMNL